MRMRVAANQWKVMLVGLLVLGLAATTATAGPFDHLLNKVLGGK